MGIVAIHGRRFIVVPPATGPVDPTEPNEPDPAPSGDKVIIHGDSISSGANATSSELAYNAIYAALTGHNVQMMAQYSRTVQEAVQPWNAKNSLENVVFTPTANQAQYNPIIPYDPSYRYLMSRLGVNDCIQKAGSTTTVATFKAKYKLCLLHMMNVAGWPSHKIKLIGIGSYFGTDQVAIDAIAPYNAAIVELGQELNIKVIDIRSFDAANGGQSLYDDIVHPNDLGHLKHAQFLASQLP